MIRQPDTFSEPVVVVHRSDFVLIRPLPDSPVVIEVVRDSRNTVLVHADALRGFTGLAARAWGYAMLKAGFIALLMEKQNDDESEADILRRLEAAV
jgi:hypothetical protein